MYVRIYVNIADHVGNWKDLAKTGVKINRHLNLNMMFVHDFIVIREKRR